MDPLQATKLRILKANTLTTHVILDTARTAIVECIVATTGSLTCQLVEVSKTWIIGKAKSTCDVSILLSYSMLPQYHGVR